jgi:hypothetical protein
MLTSSLFSFLFSNPTQPNVLLRRQTSRSFTYVFTYVSLHGIFHLIAQPSSIKPASRLFARLDWPLCGELYAQWIRACHQTPIPHNNSPNRCPNPSFQVCWMLAWGMSGCMRTPKLIGMHSMISSSVPQTQQIYNGLSLWELAHLKILRGGLNLILYSKPHSTWFKLRINSAIFLLCRILRMFHSGLMEHTAHPYPAATAVDIDCNVLYSEPQQLIQTLLILALAAWHSSGNVV